MSYIIRSNVVKIFAEFIDRVIKKRRFRCRPFFKLISIFEINGNGKESDAVFVQKTCIEWDRPN